MTFYLPSRIAGLLLAAAVLGASSCKQKDDPIVVAPATTGSLKMEFSNMVGGSHITLNNTWYINAANDSFQITKYNYYVSNIVLHTTDGKNYTEPESYHLVEEDKPATWKFQLANVPVGDYTSVTYLIGVDSARNTSGAQTGDLDPLKGMIWDWNTGYIMAKMEGQANTSTRTAKAFSMHIAGFSGMYNVIKTVTLPFPEHAKVTGTTTPNVHIFSDAQAWFKGAKTISLADYNNVMTTGQKALDVSNNYVNMFRVDHVDN